MGRAELKVFFDNDCTKELKKNDRGLYILEIKPLINNIRNDYVKKIFVKNVGNKQTYSFNYDGLYNGLSITVECIKPSATDIFYPGDKAELKITIPNNLITVVGEKELFICLFYDDIAKMQTDVKQYNTVNKIAQRTCKELEGLNMREMEWSYHEQDLTGNIKVGIAKKEYDIKIIQ